MINPVFVLTTDCNLGCKHCLRGNSTGLHLPFEVIEKVLDGAKKYGIESVHLTGGEPFLYKDLERLFKLALDLKVPLTFSTNGLLLRKNEQLLRKYRAVIRALNISLDGITEKTHSATRGVGVFDKVIDSFDFCRKNRFEFGVLYCVNSVNRLDYRDVVKFARRQKASYVHFTTVLPCTNSRQNKLVLSESERKDVLRELQEVNNFAARDKFRLFYVPLSVTEALCAQSNVLMCATQGLYRVTIDVTGDIHFCCFLTVYDAPKDVNEKLRMASILDKGFDECLKIFTERISSFTKTRIDDYSKKANDSLDFNSCFYCIKKFGI